MKHDADDKQVLECCALGEREALRTLFDRYHKVIFSYLLTLVSNRQEAEDILQDLFVKLFCRTPPVVRNSVRNYLFSVARNIAFDRMKAGRGIAGPISGDMLIEPVAGSKLELQEQATVIQQALFALPVEQREILVLHLFHGMNFAEAEEWLGIAKETLYSRYRTGLTALRRSLRDYEL